MGRFGQLTASCIHDGYAYDGVSSIAFDAVEECVWTGSLTGTLYQQLTPSLDCYAALNTNQSSGPVLRLQTLGQSVVALSSGHVGVYMSGGACRACYLDRRMDMSDMVYRHWNHQVLIGRSGVDISGEAIDPLRSKHVFMYDVVRSSVISEFETAHPVALMAPLSSGQVVMASPTGDLMVFDPRQGNITGNGSVGQTKVFLHGFAALESSGNLIATSGYGGLAHRPALEPFVKVFDSRMGIKALASIPFSNGPSFLRFHPTLRSTVLACSSGGMFSMIDTAGTTLESYFVDMGGDTVSACDFNMNGDCIVFGGANGSVNLWGSENAAVTATGLVPEYAAPFDRSMVPYMDDTTSFSVATNYAVHHQIEGQATASHVRPEEVMSVGLPPRVVDEALPLGNGILGALVWGDGRPLKISLDRTDLWDLTPVPEFQSADYNYATMREWHEQGRQADLVRVYEAPYNRPAPTKIPMHKGENAEDAHLHSVRLVCPRRGPDLLIPRETVRRSITSAEGTMVGAQAADLRVFLGRSRICPRNGFGPLHLS